MNSMLELPIYRSTYHTNFAVAFQERGILLFQGKTGFYRRPDWPAPERVTS